MSGDSDIEDATVKAILAGFKLWPLSKTEDRNVDTNPNLQGFIVSFGALGNAY